ncbi:hypothetical protein [Chamaesiphon sp. VAR_69_metabat_338]|uniref:hypothetical protein n=1 Tax=Chamaesiphon sp. VAR_69_metabat_338 TaxID=2964704 RepID=UPI00286E33AB|nr:hypothetical protein [Chamaesiphon sp. VAR_69_metabat_338]
MTSIKCLYLFGVRSLVIRRAKGFPRILTFTPCFYETAKILDRVRELAGEEHILVRALEKELSRPRYELTKLWVGVIGTIALMMSIYLIGGNMYAAEQEKPLEQAIAIYVRQHPKTAPNQSAIELQSLITKLGLSVEVFGDGSEVKVKPEQKAIAEWKEIQNTLDNYLLKELKKVEGSIELPPEKLAIYLKTHQAEIEAIETHLINNPIPKWGFDSGWVEKSDLKAADSPFSKWMNYPILFTIDNVIVVNTLYKQLYQVDISSNLAALENLQQCFQAQPSLLGQLISRIGEDRILKLARRLDKVPTGWGDNLFSRNRRRQMISAIESESMGETRIFQSSSSLDRLLNESQNPLRFVPGYSQLALPRIRLAAIERHREVEKGLASWSDRNICHTDGKSNIKLTSGLEDYNYWYLITPLDLINQYPKLLRKDLSWELTTSVRQVKAKLAAGENVDLVAKDFNLPSKVCSGENWTAKAKDGAVSIEFSHPPDWKALGVSPKNIEPLTYKVKPIDR